MYRVVTGTLVMGEQMPMLLHYPQKLLLLAKYLRAFAKVTDSVAKVFCLLAQFLGANA